MLTICKEIVVFLILAKMLEGFQNGSKYGKFLKLIVSLVVVLKLITPIFSFFNGEFDLEKVTAEIEQRFTIESGEMELAEEVENVEDIEIAETTVTVEEIKWEK